MATTSFKQVQASLDALMTAWTRKHGTTPDLPGVHSDPNMGWKTKDQLASSAPFGI